MKAGLAALILALLTAAPAAAADLTAPQAIEALRRHVCFSRTWWADPYARLGQTATVDLRLDGRTAYLWSEDLRAIPRVRRWADSYMVVMRAGGPMVTQRSGYNIELLRGEPAYERERRRVYAAQTQRIRVELPATCEPKFDPDTPAKIEMRAAVLASLSTAIATWGRRPARGRVRMTVANFNPDYPETFAVRQDTGEVLRIGLAAGDGRYAVAPVPPGIVATQLRRLIQTYGETKLVTVR
ncbi:MAG: hypothetical protein KKE02_10195 [Alphaproteobacteria bacterium]|nr:hypothetical protein [Alphaproteobacteria bacterium]MBU1514573.1 hypothetical protein [Alphaproteobacteria bacterium]MBU2096795.1 hypothetical protein [Alphaproteobacteria bacterium]MBU2151377.1 hypothetical protein [Alphaproteobacteria bacterium]MBU2307878.1 hypothetical protein [Alphaproteobacteria bacterium]